jgi:ATP-binding cassette subfamily B protein
MTASRATLGQKLRTALRLDRAVRLVWESAPGWTLLNMGLSLIQGLFPLASLYLMKRLVDEVTAATGASDPAGAFRTVLFWIVAAGGVALLSSLCGAIYGMAGATQSQVVTDHVSDLLHAQSISVDLEYYDDPRYSDTLHRAQQEAAGRPASIVGNLFSLGQNILSLTAITALLFSFNRVTGLVLFCVALPAAVVRIIYARRQFSFENEQAENERLAEYYHEMMINPGPAKEIRLFNLGTFFRERFLSLRILLREGRLKLARRQAVADLFMQGGATVAVFGTFAFIAFQTVGGSITLGGMVMYFQGFQRGLGALQSILQSLAGLYENNLFLTNFYRFLDLTPKIQSPDSPLPLPPQKQRVITCDMVSFTYPGASREILKEINLRLAPGEVIALVGENGSGKTTLIKLLCRLYDPTAGRITLDGADLCRYDPLQWRREFSVIFQDYVHYDLSARENIRLGDVDQRPDLDRIVAAARKTGADPVIRRLPFGYDTVLCRHLQNGAELSIGEWQKVALARALLRESPIVVLDEPTSSLDPLAEADIFRQFRSMIEGRSAIIISHRLSTVQIADRIYVLKEGRIVEEGSHRELLRRNGHYALLYNSQAENYRYEAADAINLNLAVSQE